MQLSLEEFGFKSLEYIGAKIPECTCLLKRQTLATNRAICVVNLEEPPSDIGMYVTNLRRRVAFRVGFVPIFWGLGLQIIIVCPRLIGTLPF